ncbi:MAG: hypothetical protein FWC20_07730 [Oscillospiraceae bacterium]|nr:hypothetical protein [Oscillospiraceae bacterium]MCL2279279.1 hypothetical protein [Oscillospiraceae bacterium]
MQICIATLKWELIESHAVRRQDVSRDDFSEYINFLQSEWVHWNTDLENAAILKLHPTAKEVFSHLDTIEITRENAFLLRPMRLERY